MSNLLSQIKIIEKKLASMKLGTRVHFFDSHDEYDRAWNEGSIGKNDVCFIEDVPEVD